MKLLEVVWGKQDGWVSLPILHGEEWHERWLEWPNDKDEIRVWIGAANKRASVYFSPLVYNSPSRRTALEIKSRWAWADFDEVDPKRLDPKPTILWQTSPGKYQGLYLLTKPVRGNTLERINRRIAISTRADSSGWDAGQVLRVPGTRNFKYDGAPKGRMLSVKGPKYDPQDFDHIELPPEADVQDLEDLNFEHTLNEWRDVLPSDALKLLDTDPDSVERGKRSDNLWRLTLSLTETGLNKHVIYTLIKGSPWNKFRGRSDEETRLKKEIAKASEKVVSPIIQTQQVIADEDETPTRPVGSGELSLPKHSWLRQYIEASNLYVPGVPYVYHLACGLSLLSMAVARSVTIANVDAKMHPVLWTLLVAPSNSGKSRTYDFMMDVFEKTGLYDQIPPINSFSPEGIIEAVSASPRRQAWLVPDEAGGLFKTIRSRDYMAGTRELLNSMADGRIISRKTKATEIMLQNYSLNFYGTTQPEGFLTSLGTDDMSTGFLRRFFILYRNEYQDVAWRMLPPGRDNSVNGLAKGLLDLQYHVTQGHPPVDITRNGERIAIAQPDRTELTLSAGAFRRFVSMDSQNRQLSRNRPELAPFLSGASSHLLKVASLITLANYPELWAGGATISDSVMEQAAVLLEGEVDNTTGLLGLIGHGEDEKTMQIIIDFLDVQPGKKATRTDIQRRFGRRIGTKWDMDKLEETMVDRGLITVVLERTSAKAKRPAKVYRLLR